MFFIDWSGLDKTVPAESTRAVPTSTINMAASLRPIDTEPSRSGTIQHAL